MKFLLSALLCVLGCAANDLPPNQPDWDHLVDNINNDPASTWKARKPAVRDVYRMLDLAGGYKPLSKDEIKLAWQDLSHIPKASLPTSYDARTAFPNCTTISTVEDQCGCGSCFAFGAIEAFQDRVCIHITHKPVKLSVEDIISCHVDENMSCQGGNPIAVWQNIIAGSKSDDGAILDSCYPYQITPCPCNHHNPNSTLPKCTPEGTGDTPQCDLMKKFSCQDNGIYKSKQPLLIPSADMEAEIVQNGPITVAYTVFDDFLTYTSGIYQKSADAQPLGGHSVKIVGYGVSNGTKYWTVANSWNSEFGEDGFFRIVRGTDECGIESLAVVAGVPIPPSP